MRSRSTELFVEGAARMGIPMTPTPEIAQRILTEMQELSKPFGTKIEIKDNIGIIRVTP